MGGSTYKESGCQDLRICKKTPLWGNVHTLCYNEELNENSGTTQMWFVGTLYCYCYNDCTLIIDTQKKLLFFKSNVASA